jgi:hypothetical protein
MPTKKDPGKISQTQNLKRDVLLYLCVYDRVAPLSSYYTRLQNVYIYSFKESAQGACIRMVTFHVKMTIGNSMFPKIH